MNKKSIKIVFMGTPQIAVASLDAIVTEGYNVVGVVTAPDRPAGRGRKLQSSDVKKYALQNNLPVLQPENLKEPQFLEELRSLQADLHIVVAFRMLPKAVWSMPLLGTFNMHASLLPQYRGAAPINHAIIQGEKKTGVTTFFLDENIDTGSIILSKTTDISRDDNAGTLHDKLMVLGAEAVIETIKLIETSNIETQSQKHFKENELNKAPKIFKEDCRINWNQNTDKIFDFIRGLSPYPAAFTELKDPEGDTYVFKIFEAKKVPQNHEFSPGKMITDNKNFIKVYGLDGFLDVLELQLAGKKRMKTPDFLRGYGFKPFFSGKTEN